MWRVTQLLVLELEESLEWADTIQELEESLAGAEFGYTLVSDAEAVGNLATIFASKLAAEEVLDLSPTETEIDVAVNGDDHVVASGGPGGGAST